MSRGQLSSEHEAAGRRRAIELTANLVEMSRKRESLPEFIAEFRRAADEIHQMMGYREPVHIADAMEAALQDTLAGTMTVSSGE